MPVSFTDEMLREAVITADRYRMDALPPDDQIGHVFSRRFERSMKKLIEEYKTGRPAAKPRIRRKRWVAVLVAVMIVVSSAVSVSAVREKIFELVTQAYEKYTQIFFSETQPSQSDSGVFTISMPTYIPDGFQLVHEETNGMVLREYQKDDDFISYQQQPLDKVSMHINTEGVPLEDTTLNGLPAKYYSNQGMQNLIWYDSHTMYMVSSTLDRAAVFRISESVKPAKNKN